MAHGSAPSLAPPARTLLVLSLPTVGEADLLQHTVAQALQETKSSFSAVLGSVCHPSSEIKESFLSP